MKKTPQAWPLGYAEDVFEPRTKLEAVFSGPTNKKAFALAQGRRLARSVVPPCFSDRNSITLIRNPSRGSGGVHYYLLHGLGSEASSALNGLACTVSTWTASSLSSVSVAYYSSSTPLVFRL